MWNSVSRDGGVSGTNRWLLRFFDQIRFTPIGERELLAFRAAFLRGNVGLQIEETTFRFAEYRAFLDQNQASIEAFRLKQRAAFAEERARWALLPPLTGGARSSADEAGEGEALPADAVAIRAAITGSVWEIAVVPGAHVAAGERLIVLETMKMETPLVAPVAGRSPRSAARAARWCVPGRRSWGCVRISEIRATAGTVFPPGHHHRAGGGAGLHPDGDLHPRPRRGSTTRGAPRSPGIDGPAHEIAGLKAEHRRCYESLVATKSAINTRSIWSGSKVGIEVGRSLSVIARADPRCPPGRGPGARQSHSCDHATGSQEEYERATTVGASQGLGNYACNSADGSCGRGACPGGGHPATGRPRRSTGRADGDATAAATRGTAAGNAAAASGRRQAAHLDRGDAGHASRRAAAD